MINPFAHPLVGKRVRYRGHERTVKYVMRNPQSEAPDSGREWAGLTMDDGATTTAWLEECEVVE